MREPETYRLDLEQVLSYFGDKRILTLGDVASYTGHSRKWVRDNLGITGDVTAVKLAYTMSKL